ncbi:uncharacterized protein LOC114524088 [Dendronephthya gigantea]|uniref:uncharacterized protein LOC114524088 n=1 Tax=Dendronephthya gigantea TaxID=151771 RepID=UPI00106A367C|nr:uncharacterized protein LOC114524088 [Dendronephthya gigantea]
MAALNALADYSSENSDGNSSESSSESEETDGEEQGNDTKIDVAQEKLPLPDILNENPQQKRSEFASVKMDDHSASVFFNPFKAKEDEKLAILERHVKLTERKDDTKGEKAKFRRSKNAHKVPKRQNFHGQDQRNDNDDGFKAFQKRKRRVGVNDSLIPPKRALQAYEKQRRDEAPRT